MQQLNICDTGSQSFYESHLLLWLHKPATPTTRFLTRLRILPGGKRSLERRDFENVMDANQLDLIHGQPPRHCIIFGLIRPRKDGYTLRALPCVETNPLAFRLIER